MENAGSTGAGEERARANSRRYISCVVDKSKERERENQRYETSASLEEVANIYVEVRHGWRSQKSGNMWSRLPLWRA